MGTEACRCRPGAGAHHVDDLGQGDLQGDVERPVRVLRGAQGAGVVGEEVVEQLVGEPALRAPAACGTRHGVKRCDGKRGDTAPLPTAGTPPDPAQRCCWDPHALRSSPHLCLPSPPSRDAQAEPKPLPVTAPCTGSPIPHPIFLAVQPQNLFFFHIITESKNLRISPAGRDPQGSSPTPVSTQEHPKIRPYV